MVGCDSLRAKNVLIEFLEPFTYLNWNVLSRVIYYYITDLNITTENRPHRIQPKSLAFGIKF